jgi:PAS domain S-box-containing protein
MTAHRILIVEDEGVVALEIQDRLDSLGYGVIGVAASGERAIQLAAQHRPDLVLMDIILRGDMDGIEAAHQIQQKSNIPVVYLTAHSDEATLQRAKVTTPFGYVIKPFEERDLHVAIEMALYKHQIDQELRASEERLRLLVESGNDIIMVLDGDGKYTYVHGLAQFGGRDADKDIIGQTPYDIFDYDTATLMMQRTKKVLASDKAMTVEVELPLNGKSYWFNEHIYPLKKDNGKITFVAVVARNVSEIRRLKGLLPICAWCGRNIKDGHGRWQRLDMYLVDHANVQVSHGLCPECHHQLVQE